MALEGPSARRTPLGPCSSGTNRSVRTTRFSPASRPRAGGRRSRRSIPVRRSRTRRSSALLSGSITSDVQFGPARSVGVSPRSSNTPGATTIGVPSPSSSKTPRTPISPLARVVMLSTVAASARVRGKPSKTIVHCGSSSMPGTRPRSRPRRRVASRLSSSSHDTTRARSPPAASTACRPEPSTATSPGPMPRERSWRNAAARPLSTSPSVVSTSPVHGSSITFGDPSPTMTDGRRSSCTRRTTMEREGTPVPATAMTPAMSRKPGRP